MALTEIHRSNSRLGLEVNSSALDALGLTACGPLEGGGQVSSGKGQQKSPQEMPS